MAWWEFRVRWEIIMAWSMLHVGLWRGHAAVRIPYTIILDAGSSATRMKVYRQLTESQFYEMKHDETTPGLDVAKDKPYEYLKPLLQKAADLIPVQDQPMTRVLLYGTAGMRKISFEDQDKIYTSIYQAAMADGSILFHFQRANLRTISGEEEAYFGVLAVNYLTKRVSADLEPGKEPLYGALDLGGASTQFTCDLRERWRRHSGITGISRRQRIRQEDFLSHSFLGYGVNDFMDRVMTSIVADSSHKNNNPCMFPGYTALHKNVLITGTGYHKECMNVLQNIIDAQNAKCPENTTCSLESRPRDRMKGTFYALSVFQYAVGFAKALVEKRMKESVEAAQGIVFPMPNPSLKTLEDASRLVCATPYSTLTKEDASIDSFTPLKNLHRRCFDLCYTIVLLKQYGFSDDERRVFFTNSIHSQSMEMEWSIGAYLVYRKDLRREDERLEHMRQVILYEEGLPIGHRTALLVGGLAVVAMLYIVFESRWRFRGLRDQSFVFVDHVKD